MDEIIPPRILKGFRDSLPETEAAKSRMIRSLERTFEPDPNMRDLYQGRFEKYTKLWPLMAGFLRDLASNP